MTTYYSRSEGGDIFPFGGQVAKDETGRPVDRDGNLIELVEERQALTELYDAEFADMIMSAK